MREKGNDKYGMELAVSVGNYFQELGSWCDKRHIKGTVKDHKVIRNVETTVLTRCTLVK